MNGLCAIFIVLLVSIPVGSGIGWVLDRQDEAYRAGESCKSMELANLQTIREVGKSEKYYHDSGCNRVHDQWLKANFRPSYDHGYADADIVKDPR